MKNESAETMRRSAIKWYENNSLPFNCRICSEPVDKSSLFIACYTRRKQWLVMHQPCYEKVVGSDGIQSS